MSARGNTRERATESAERRREREERKIDGWNERERGRTTITSRAYRAYQHDHSSTISRGREHRLHTTARCNKDAGTVTMAWCGRVSGSCRLQVVCLLGNQPLRTVPTEGLFPTMRPLYSSPRSVHTRAHAYISRSLSRSRLQSRSVRVHSKVELERLTCCPDTRTFPSANRSDSQT